MGRSRILFLFALSACAHALPVEGEDASLGDASISPDGAKVSDASPDGTPPGQCNSSQTKCTSADGGALCVDTKSDPDHCGACTTECATADAGSLPPGPNNPDPDVPFDGGYDGGIGWSVGSPACDGGACAIDCPQAFTECSDGVCYDTANHHDHCGSCTTACQPTQWCTQGHCCSQGTAYCNGSCTDVLSDDKNCGACGNACPSQKPVCSKGTCISSVVYSQAFTGGQVASTQCTAWNTFLGALTGTYSSVTMSGTFDATGHTCTGANANTICQALHTGTAVTNLSCGGYVWNVLPSGSCGNGVALASNGTDNGCACLTSADYSVRPCIGTTENWGAINTAACPPPSQTLTVMCQ